MKNVRVGRGQAANPLPGLVVLLLFCAVLPARAEVHWTGAAGDGLWSTPGNWAGGALPATNQTAVFGVTASNGWHTVIVDAEYAIKNVKIDGDGTEADQRRFHFIQANDGKLTSPVAVGGAGLDFFHLTPTVAGDVMVDVPIRIDAEQTVWLTNWSDQTVKFLQDIDLPGPSVFLIRGGIQEVGAVTNPGTFRTDSRTYPVDLTLRSSAITATTTLNYWEGNRPSVFRFGADVTFRGLLVAANVATNAYFQSVAAGADDRTVTFTRNLTGSSTAGKVVFLDNEEGSTGRFIMRMPGTGSRDGTHTLAIETRDNTVIQFDPASLTVDAQMTFGATTNLAMVISGGGSLWKSNTGTLQVHTVNSYTGRTMISGGTLRLDEHTLGADTFQGQLPEGTVVEIGAGAVFDLNGIDQTIGGLSHWTGLAQTNTPSSGSVTLGGGTLTVQAAQDSTFGGSVAGAGTLIKSGPATLALGSAAVTNAAGEAVRVAGGLLEVSGALSLDQGSLVLAGGRVAAGSLNAAGLEWNVTLSGAYAGGVLVDVAGAADITFATLELGLAEGYEPALGTKFTLLRADTITGVAPDGVLFWSGYNDGDDFMLGDVPFRIDLETGSEQIVLTVIPEPAALGLLGLAGLGLLFRHRRRRD